MSLAKKTLDGASQHVTAGPYSPILEIECSKLIVISGQISVDCEGNVLGNTIEEQAHCMLENCKAQFATAGCTLEDVFKCNVYMTDLADWSRFNAVYMEIMPKPYPVRTAVGVNLLPNVLVEIEMWAAKK